MKKKFLSVVMTAMMVASLLTACGGDKKAETAAPAKDTKTEAAAPAEDKKEEAAAPEEDAAEDTAEADGMVSDETFGVLQDNYALMVESYNAVAEAYNSDEIAANAELEEAMGQAADVIEQMGEITQDSLTEEDAIALNDSIGEILKALSEVADGLVAEATAGDAAGEAEGEMVSDETFAALQENYSALADAYNAVAEAYNSDEIAADADIESTMNQAYEIIEQMGEISQDSITEADAQELVDAMVKILEVLEAVVNSMG